MNDFGRGEAVETNTTRWERATPPEITQHLRVHCFCSTSKYYCHHKRIARGKSPRPRMSAKGESGDTSRGCSGVMRSDPTNSLYPLGPIIFRYFGPARNPDLRADVDSARLLKVKLNTTLLNDYILAHNKTVCLEYHCCIFLVNCQSLRESLPRISHASTDMPSECSRCRC